MDKLYQPELLVTARDITEVKALANAGADAIIIGHQHYGLRVAGDFSIADIAEATSYLHQANKKVYILVNAIFHNAILKTLPLYINQLAELQVDGIICGDPSIFTVMEELEHKIPITWNPETLSTNYQTLMYWHQKGIKRAILSNELALDAIKEIKKELSFPIEVQVHGMTCIFQSKRKLVRNYYSHIDLPYDPDLSFHLKETKEEDTHYPVYEDENGTHIMSNEDLCMIDQLEHVLDTKMDGLRINGLLHSRSYNIEVVAMYRDAVDTYLEDPVTYHLKKVGWKQKLYKIQPEARKLNTGFYFKEQIY
ncbi:peptidase U32 family protein [Paraliobacillus sediminis]|uniref:peptidase U32 family protein n=1 Tax=Paraliobacillus sediminis TaxID=1885916 RepID=UPI000E3E385E|nr:peptidase U32 family protein [Paraliobacillus sediminis]